MQDLFNRYIIPVKRWLWVIVLGLVICGGATYVISKLTKPTYQATVIFVLNVDTSSSDTNSSIVAVPTYAQLVTNPVVLNPVVAKHPDMTLQQLTAMVTVKPQTNTQLIELDVQSGNPQLSAQVANDVGQSFLQYANSQLQGRLGMLPAQVPTDPIKPKPLQDSGIGALVGLGLAVSLIVVFEWLEDHLSSPENAQELLGLDILAFIPQFPKKLKSKDKRSATLMEKYRMLAASLNAAQASKPFKVVLVTSALPGEGKSTVVANLATFLAMTGKRVLLIDANLHHPVLGQRFEIVNDRGFSTVLHEMSDSAPPLEIYGQETDIPTLRVLTSGPTLVGSAELLQAGVTAQLFNHLQEAPFDYVLVDAPSLLAVADAQILTSLVQAVLVVVDAHKTPRRALKRMKQVLGRTSVKILGVALNNSPWTDTGTSYQDAYKKTQGQEELYLLMSPAVSASHPMRLMLPFNSTPVPASLSKPADTQADKAELSDTQRLSAPPHLQMNEEVSKVPTTILGQPGKSPSLEKGHSRSNNPKRQS